MNLKQNKQLIKKHNNSKQMQSQMKQISFKFQQLQQQALYSQFPSSQKKIIQRINKNKLQQLTIFSGKTITNLLIYFGANQTINANNVQKLILNTIYKMPRPIESYSIIYINTLASNNAYSDFKKMFDKLPFQYLTNLEYIYVLHASFLSKAGSWLVFDTITSYIKDKTIHVDSFQQLAEKAMLNIEQLYKLMPTYIVDQLCKKEVNLLEVARKTSHNVLEAQQKLKIEKKKSEEFMVTYVGQVHNKQFQLQSYETGGSGAPLIIQLLIYFFDGHEHQLQVEGIFRKNSSFEQINQILIQLQAKNYQCIGNITDGILIANILKRFLSKLNPPLIPYITLHQFIKCNQKQLKQLIIKSVQGFDKKTNTTLLILLQFFKQKIIPRSNYNKMTLKNMSIVMGPCFMRTEVASIQDVIEAKRINMVLQIILQEFQTIFGDKKKRMKSLRESAIMFGGNQIKEKLADPELQLEFQMTKQQEEINQKETKNEKGKLISQKISTAAEKGQQKNSYNSKELFSPQKESNLINQQLIAKKSEKILNLQTQEQSKTTQAQVQQQ